MGRIRGKFCAALFIIAGLSGPSQVAWAYTPTLTAKGVPVRWKGRAKLDLAGNPSNQSGLSASSIFDAVVRGLQRWSSASGGSVAFDYWQGTDTRTYEPNSEYNGLSSIYFASASPSNANLSPNVLGLTQVWYNTDTGEILETDVVLNDLHYRFTNDPRDTSGYGSTNPPAGDMPGGRGVYVDNVITHELGHAFGLSHSGGLQSTMLFMESPEQAFLGCDEQVGVRAVYPSSDSGSRGAIAGSVVAESSGAPIFGAHVLAISRQRGSVMASAVTDPGGRYRIDALEPGDYFLMVEPFYAGPAALPTFYGGMNVKVCSGQAFGRTMLLESGGIRPANIGVGGGQTIAAPQIAARCGSGGAALTADRTTSNGSNYFSEATAVFDGNTGARGFGVVDRFVGASTMYYELKNIGGRLEIHALAYSLYSPIDPEVEILDASGNEMATDSADNVYPGSSGFVNYDSVAIARDLPRGNYTIRVKARSLNASLYPAGPTSLDTVPFLVLTGSVNESGPSMANVIPANARCRMDENFGTYSSPAGGPPRGSKQQAGKKSKGTGFCGILSTQAQDGDGGGDDGEGPGAAEIAGWFLPWVMMGLMLRVARRMELRVRLTKANLYA